MLALAWKASGADPYRLYNGLDELYRPLRNPSLPARPPKFPERVRAFVYACAEYVRETERKDQAVLIKALQKAMAH